jgi:hypothetical protein
MEISGTPPMRLAEEGDEEEAAAETEGELLLGMGDSPGTVEELLDREFRRVISSDGIRT